MASKEKLRAQLDAARDALEVAREDLVELRGELDELSRGWAAESVDYESRLGEVVDQTAKFDRVRRERDLAVVDKVKANDERVQAVRDREQARRERDDALKGKLYASNVKGQLERELATVKRENVDLKRQLQDIRLATTELHSKVFPQKISAETFKTFAKGGIVGGQGAAPGASLRFGDPQRPVGALWNQPAVHHSR